MATQENNTLAILVLVVLPLLGCIHIALVFFQCFDNWYYKLLRGRAEVCFSGDMVNRWIMLQGFLLIIFGLAFGITRLQ